MKYYIISGEASGDLHGSNLIKQIKKLDANANIRAWGGDLMQQEGAKIVKHYKDLAFMGFVEVLMNIRTILKNISFCKNDILDFAPDVLVLIDYPGFNLRIAEFASKNNIKVVYYISPQIWAWKQSRVHKIKKYVDKMLVILPFEKDFYAKYNYPVEFVGHPLLDAISDDILNNFDKNKFIKENNLLNKPIIALLPGSRKQEIRIKLPIMLSLIDYYPDYQFVIAGATSLPDGFYKQFLSKKDNVKILFGKTYDILNASDAALVTSGTATLETAIFEVPQVVCYKSGSRISYEIAKRLVKIKYISLVNLIMDKELVKELIQDDLNTKNLKSELDKVLTTNRSRILSDYKQLKQKLGNSGASAKAAKIIVDLAINE